MYIKDLHIKNFRSIDYLHLELTKGKNVIVGKNNAGKSNIIKALDITFGDKNPQFSEVAYTDFHEPSQGCCDEFWILSKLMETDINEEELRKIKGIYRGKLRGAPLSNNNPEGRIEIVTEHSLFDVDEYFKPYEKQWFKPNGIGNAALGELIQSLKKARWLWVLFHAANTGDQEHPYAKEYRFFYQETVEVGSGNKQADAQWYAIWGVSTAFRDALITSAILPAFREPVTQLKATAWSWYGKLLKRVWDEKKGTLTEKGSVSDKLLEALTHVEIAGNNIYETLARDISSKIQVAFNDTAITFRYFHNLKDIYKQVQVFVNDGYDSNLQNKGSGIQSAVIIGLFSYYCSSFHQNTTILAIEEPELYLHPQARRVISKRLSDFVNISPNKQNQVIVITHSAEFIRAGEINNISVIKKSGRKTTSAHYKIDNENKSEIQTLLRSENSEMFFADKVIICEGGEKFILPTMVDSITGKQEHLDECNISVVRANGKTNIDRIRELLDKCNIEHCTIADLDYLFYGLDTKLHPSIGLIRGMKAEIKAKWIKEKGIRERVSSPGNSRDAEAFCEQMDKVKANSELLPDLINLWDALRPRLMEKINHQYLDSKDGEPLKTAIESCLTDLWNEHKIYILRRGELEDYLTDAGYKEAKGSKETRLLKIRELVESGRPIEEFFMMDEFNAFLGVAMALENNSPLTQETSIIESSIPSTDPPVS